MNTQTKSLAAPSRPEREYYGALDGFRGVLACVVAVYHTIWLSNVNTTTFLNNGQVLVDLFFVFSGFLLFRIYSGRLDSAAKGVDFIRRRIARIYPLHFFMLMVFVLFQAARVLAHYVGVSHLDPGEILPYQTGATETLASFFANLTLTQSMGVLDSLSYNVPAWTVSVEFWTYFVFLGVMLFAPPRRTWQFVLIGVLIAVLFAILSQIKPNMDFHYDYGFWRCIGGFFSGIIVARLYSALKFETRNGVMTGWAHILEVLTLVVLIGFVIYWTGKMQFFVTPVLALFVFTFAIGRGFVSKVMSTKPMLYLGKISYSIYMVHMIVSAFFAALSTFVIPVAFGPDWNLSGFGGDLLLIPYLAVTILVSHYTYHWIELPGQKAIMAWKMPESLRRLVGVKLSKMS